MEGISALVNSAPSHRATAAHGFLHWGELFAVFCLDEDVEIVEKVEGCFFFFINNL